MARSRREILNSIKRLERKVEMDAQKKSYTNDDIWELYREGLENALELGYSYKDSKELTKDYVENTIGRREITHDEWQFIATKMSMWKKEYVDKKAKQKENLKRCSHCGSYKPIDQFSKDKSNKKDGLQSWCKDCFREYYKKWNDDKVLSDVQASLYEPEETSEPEKLFWANRLSVGDITVTISGPEETTTSLTISEQQEITAMLVAFMWRTGRFNAEITESDDSGSN